MKTLPKDLTLCEEWSLSIDLKLPSRSTKEWSKLFSLHNNGGTNPTTASHISAAWIRPDQSSVMLMIAYNIDNNLNYTYNVTTKLNVGNWINLKISQLSGIYAIKVDYKLVYNKTNSFPKPWANVKLVTGNTNGNFLATSHYRNFEIDTCPKKG